MVSWGPSAVWALSPRQIPGTVFRRGFLLWVSNLFHGDQLVSSVFLPPNCRSTGSVMDWCGRLGPACRLGATAHPAPRPTRLFVRSGHGHSQPRDRMLLSKFRLPGWFHITTIRWGQVCSYSRPGPRSHHTPTIHMGRRLLTGWPTVTIQPASSSHTGPFTSCNRNI